MCTEGLRQHALQQASSWRHGPLVGLRHEALLRRLLGDPHPPADLRPRRARPAGLIDEVADQVVGQLTEVLGDLHRRRHVVKGRPRPGS